MTRSHSRRRYLGAIGTAGLAAVAGCTDLTDDSDTEQPAGEEDNNGEEDDVPEDDPVEDVDHRDVEGSIEFAEPTEQAEVSSPVEIKFEVEEFELQPADDEPEQGVGHMHVIVDEDCVEPGRPIPMEEGYHHLSDGETETEIELEPGEYDLCGQAGDGIHNAYALTDEISIEVVGDG